MLSVKKCPGNVVTVYHMILLIDRFRLIFWIMIIQGLGGLLPFNMFINAYEVSVTTITDVFVPEL